MIVYDLECRDGQHRFEGWFKSSDDYARQQERGFVTCPHCGSAKVGKAVQAPRLARKGNQLPDASRRQPKPPAAQPEGTVPPAAAVPAPSAPPSPAQVAEMMQALATMQANALKNSRYVGDSFANDARAMHYGDREAETIHGRATVTQAQELMEEGIGLVPLPFPVVPPDQAN
jgi:hypothetical protein